MKRKSPQVFTILSVLTVLLCLGSLQTKAQVITGPTSVYPGGIGIYELSPHVSSSVYVSWCLSWHGSSPDGQIISAPPNSCLEGYGANMCYVNWSSSLDRASLQVDFPRGGTGVSYLIIYITRKTDINGMDSLVAETSTGEKSPITIRKRPAFNFLSFNN